jgi:hypothetical protein
MDKSLKQLNPKAYARRFEQRITALESITSLRQYASELWKWNNDELRELCKLKHLTKYSSLNKRDLIGCLIQHRKDTLETSNHVDSPQSKKEFDFNEFVGIAHLLPEVKLREKGDR